MNHSTSYCYLNRKMRVYGTRCWNYERLSRFLSVRVSCARDFRGLCLSTQSFSNPANPQNPANPDSDNSSTTHTLLKSAKIRQIRVIRDLRRTRPNATCIQTKSNPRKSVKSASSAIQTILSLDHFTKIRYHCKH